MYYALFNGFPERLNANYLPTSNKLDQGDEEFLLQPRLFIRGDAMNLSLQLVTDTLRISPGPGCGSCLSFR